LLTCRHWQDSPELIESYPLAEIYCARGGSRPSSVTFDITLLLKRIRGAVGTNVPAPRAPILTLSDVLPRWQKLSLCMQCAWKIEMLIKDEKQQLGLSDYRVLRYRAVVRHLHLVDVAYACLTHLALKDQAAQGRKKNRVLHLPTMSQLKARDDESTQGPHASGRLAGGCR